LLVGGARLVLGADSRTLKNPVTSSSGAMNAFCALITPGARDRPRGCQAPRRTLGESSRRNGRGRTQTCRGDIQARRGGIDGSRHQAHHLLVRAFRSAAVPILATRNSAPGAHVRVEVEIVAAGRSIKAHETHPIRNVTSLTRHPNMAYCWRIRGTSGHRSAFRSRAVR
jgi:hypothetical protein